MLTRSKALLVCLMATAVAATGCNSGTNKTPAQGNVKLVVSSQALQNSDIQRVEATITGKNTATPPAPDNTANIPTAITATLGRNGTGFNGLITNIPAGGIRIEVKAYDAATGGKVVYSGGSDATVAPGQTALATILLQQTTPPPPFVNAVPVITALSASQGTVFINPANPQPGVVNLAVTATDPNGDPLTYQWSASCGTLTGATTPNATFTSPITYPQTCTISIKVSDDKGANVTGFLSIAIAAQTNGDVRIVVNVNTSPVISAITAAVQFQDSRVTPPVVTGLTADLAVTATDAEGDTLAYSWAVTGTGCGTFDDATKPNPKYTQADKTKACTVVVTVSDGKGGSTTGSIALGTGVNSNTAPVIVRAIGPATVAPDQAYQLEVDASDAENDALTYVWTQEGGTLVAGSQVDAAGKSTISWKAPNPLVVTMSATATVSDGKGGTTLYKFVFAGSDPCIGKANGTACDDGNACTQTDTCQNNVCTGANPVVCAASDACHDVGVCQLSGANAGTCTNPAKANGASCSDGNACTQTDTCQAGACVGTNPVTCTAAGQCFDVGTCNPASGACSTPPKAAGTACSDNNKCTTGEACDGAGACAGGTAVTCTASQCSNAGACDPATGCPGPKPDGTTCTGPDTCQTYACQGGSCAGAPKCAVGQTCTGGVCADQVSIPKPQLAKAEPLSGLGGIAQDASAASYVAGTLACAFDINSGLCGPVAFDTKSVTPAGSSDAVVVKYGASGAAVWATDISGGAGEIGSAGNPTDQTANGVAVAQNGEVAVIGTTNGGVVLGTISLANTGSNSTLLFLNGSTGAGVKGYQFNLGAGGIQAIASNPGKNLIAFCGAADIAATDLVTGAVSGGNGNRDVIIAVYDAATNNQVWAKQLGAGGDEECDSIAVDDNGDIYAAGKYNTPTGQTPLNPGLGALPSTTSQNFRYIWVAKFSGTNGAAQAQAAYGTGPGNHTPKGLAVDAAGNVFVGGSFTFTLPIGSTSLVSAGNTDGFVARLKANATGGFDAAWAVRIGNAGSTPDTVNAVTLASNGDVIAAGSFTGPGTTTGAAALVNAGQTDAFVLKLASGTGSTQFAAAYGDTASQSIIGIAANRTGAGAAKDKVVFGGANGGSIVFPAPAGTLPLSSAVWFVAFADLAP